MTLRPIIRSFLVCATALFLLALTPSSPKGCNSMTCEERVDAANDYIYSVLDQHLECRDDTDCTSVWISTDCQGACPVAVNVEGVDDVEAAVEHANETWCDGYIEDGCPYATPGCIAAAPACDGGTCVMVPLDY